MDKIGFIGLGNVSGKLARSLIRNGYDVVVRDLDLDAAASFIDSGAKWADRPKDMAQMCDIIITCRPSREISAALMEAEYGILAGLTNGKIWAEMSTTDPAKVT